MDIIDRRILNLLQEGFPVVPDPYAAIAAQVGINEAEALDRVTRMRSEGVIRRIGALFDLQILGFVSVLCAARVPDDRQALFVETVNACPGVTHNYRRSDDYNIWFTVIAPSREELMALLAAISEKTGVSDILTLQALKTFKVNAQFEV